MCVIDDRGRVSRPYIDSSWQSVGLGWIEDTNGVPGKEIVIEARDTNGDLLCVCIIHDGNNHLTSYSDALWKSAAIYLAADTDGQAGVEIVLTYAVDGGGGVGVVRDRTERLEPTPSSGTAQLFSKSEILIEPRGKKCACCSDTDKSMS